MASKHSNIKNKSRQNKPPSCEVIDSLSKKPLEFPTFDRSRWYYTHIPSQSTLDLAYTSSPETPNPNIDPSLNKELHGVTPEDPVYQITNNKVNQLHQHTDGYLQSMSQIPIVYQIPGACTSHRRTQPYCENETLASSVNNTIIDTISEFRQLIAAIAHSENQQAPKFKNFLNFP